MIAVVVGDEEENDARIFEAVVILAGKPLDLPARYAEKPFDPSVNLGFESTGFFSFVDGVEYRNNERVEVLPPIVEDVILRVLSRAEPIAARYSAGFGPQFSDFDNERSFSIETEVEVQIEGTRGSMLGERSFPTAQPKAGVKGLEQLRFKVFVAAIQPSPDTS